MFKKKRVRSPADLRREINSAHRFVAAMCQDPEKRAQYEAQYVKDLPPKRQRAKRSSDGPSEHQEQSAVVSWWALAHRTYGLPEFSLFAVPNGGARDAITGARLKREGVRRGVFDLVLAAGRGGFHALFLEMKVGDNKPTFEQESFLQYLTSAGFKASVHWTSGSAIEEIKSYLGGGA